MRNFSGALRVGGVFALALFTLIGCANDDDDIPKKNRISVLPDVKPIMAETDPNVEAPQLTAPVRNPDWTHSGGNAIKNVGNLIGPESLKPRWQTYIGKTYDETSEVTAQPVIYAGTIYAMNADGEVIYLDAKTGKEKKRISLSPQDDDEVNIRGGGFTVGEGLLFAATGVGGLHALDLNTGEVKWALNIRVSISAPPAYSNGKLYLIDRENRLQVFQAETGQALWDYRALPSATARERTASLAISGNVIIAPFTSGEVLAFDENIRRPAWGHNILGSGLFGNFSKFNAPSADPVIAEGFVFLTSPAGITVGIDGSTGKIVWQKQIAGSVTPVVIGSALYMIDDSSNLIGLQKDTGKVFFVTQLKAYEDQEEKKNPIFWQGPLMMNNRLFAVSSAGEAVFVDPVTGKIEKTDQDAPKTSVSPAIADGSLYILSRDGYVYAY